jgi:hypothetical protein
MGLPEGELLMQTPSDLDRKAAEARGYEPPRFEKVDLACEISAYAPDEAEPLF